ncbi:MAG TPA: hypothetical protein VFU02_15470 [Polyangiaceae bacterium]|nr:hypothetical protein [Polyangiaceae bacterium]
MRTSGTVAKYLARYAVPEARLPLALPNRYEHVLVVPALGESVSFLDGIRSAYEPDPASGEAERGLLLLVVNAAPDTPPALRAKNHELMLELEAGARARKTLHHEPSIRWFDLGEFDAIVVDRSGPDHLLPERQGVGLARKLGADLALAFKARGLIRAQGFGSTDADTTLPVGYFGAGERALASAEAAVFPFVHAPSSEALLDRATLAYELSLRYYVLGLCAAGSNYAYHSLGSTLYVGFEAYAHVRGFPRLRAGEDFYLLDKLAKLGAVCRLYDPLIRIEARRSARVPFGTGPGVQRLLDASAGPEGLLLYAPRSFLVLGEVLASLAEFAHTRDAGGMRQRLAALPEARAVLSYLDALGIAEVLPDALRHAKNPDQLSRRLGVWFDALRSLRLIHALRDHCHPALPWRQALAEAPFLRVHASSLQSAVAELRQRELCVAPTVGVRGQGIG